MPFTEIKVDKPFVIKATVDEEAAAIVRMTVELGKEPGLETVAEGIEDQGIYDWMRELSCDTGQGYLIGKPVDLHHFLIWRDEYIEKAAKR